MDAVTRAVYGRGRTMSCDRCKYFKIMYEPLKTQGALYDLGRAKCERHDLITDFSNHGKFKKLETCNDYVAIGEVET